MTKKTLGRSVQVQDEAAIFQQKLDYQLLTMEQNNRLWNHGEGWRPGDAIHTHPHDIESQMSIDELVDRVLDTENGPLGNHVRPMIESLEVDPPRRVYMCNECKVDWNSTVAGDDCWNCGKKSPVSDDLKYYDYVHYDVSFSAVTFALFEFEQVWARANEGIWPIRRRVQFVDEVQLLWDGGFGNVTPYVAPSRMRSIFEKKEGPIEFVRPFAADLFVPVRERVRIPSGVDLSGRLEPELPKVVDQTHPDVLRWNHRGTYPVEVVTERRRSR